MIRCACPATSLTALRFADGVVMQRCATHEQQAWSVHGRPAARQEVLPALKDLFVDRRGEPSRTRGTPRTPPLVRQERVTYEEPPAHAAHADDGERLTALLRARGLSGTWAVA